MEEELDLIREYVVLSYLIMDIVSELKKMETQPMGSLLVMIGKDFGRRVREKQQDVKRQLQGRKVYPRILDDGGEVVMVEVSRPGQVASKHRIKRRVLAEDTRKLADALGELWGNVELQVKKDDEYKPVRFTGDPYAYLKGGN